MAPALVELISLGLLKEGESSKKSSYLTCTRLAFNTGHKSLFILLIIQCEGPTDTAMTAPTGSSSGSDPSESRSPFSDSRSQTEYIF